LVVVIELYTFLRIERFGLRVTGCELRVTGCELRVASFGYTKDRWMMDDRFAKRREDKGIGLLLHRV